jgi:tetratricopeptide (TPR) repeat protein
MHAQNAKIDSLLSVLKTAKEDTNKVNNLNNISGQYLKISDYIQGKKYCDYALSLARKINYEKGEANAHYNIGIMYLHQDKYPEALQAFNASLKIKMKIIVDPIVRTIVS